MSAMDAGPGQRRELSRRDLVRRAAAVGAVAWSTPVIVGSLASPAGAVTPGPCVPYWVKLVPGGGCSNNLPGSGSGRVCGVSGSVGYSTAGTKCGSACTAGCTGSNPGLTPSSSLSGAYYVVTLTAGSTFSSSEPWALGGRYDTSGALNNSSYTSLCPGGASGDGGYADGGTTGYVAASLRFGTTVKALQYIYVRFCRSS